MKKSLDLAILVLVIAGCANFAKYQPDNWYSGGYKDQRISESLFTVEFSGNNTDMLTIQTYWLYRASELTLEKGFDGFEIRDASPTDPPHASYRVSCPDLNLVCSRESRNPIMDAYGTIQLYKGAIKVVPFRVFNARALKERLDPIVKGANCGSPGVMLGSSMVCPHDKSYLSGK